MWTAEQITAICTQVGGILAATTVLVKTLHNNRVANDNLANSVPVEVAHNLVDNAHELATTAASIAAQAASNNGGTTLNIPAPAEIDVKEGTKG